MFISGHCVPVDDHWLQNLCQPLKSGAVDYNYGRQIGDDTSNYSERRIFAKYFPEISRVPQDGGAGRIARYAPDGRYLSQIGLPAPHASCPAFGGAQMTELFATTAMEGIAAPTAQDGQVFCCMLPHQGRPNLQCAWDRRFHRPAFRLGFRYGAVDPIAFLMKSFPIFQYCAPLSFSLPSPFVETISAKGADQGFAPLDMLCAPQNHARPPPRMVNGTSAPQARIRRASSSGNQATASNIGPPQDRALAEAVASLQTT